MSRAARTLCFTWAACALLPFAARAQDVRTAVVPADLTVGDVFHVIIRASGAGAAALSFPDSLALPPDLEAAGRRQLRQDTIGGAPGWTALYPVTAWRTGSHALPAAEVRLGDARVAAAAFPAVQIRSVLPADTSGVQPKPAKDVLGADRVWWPILLALLLLALALAAFLVWYRRRRARRPRAPELLEPALPPRERALQALDAARASGALEAGEYKRFYTAVSDALRGYAAALEPRASLDLTTTELMQRLRTADGAAELRALLHGADLVKFARRRPEQGTAADEWQRARSWVERYDLASSERGQAA